MYYCIIIIIIMIGEEFIYLSDHVYITVILLI